MLNVGSTRAINMVLNVRFLSVHLVRVEVRIRARFKGFALLAHPGGVHLIGRRRRNRLTDSYDFGTSAAVHQQHGALPRLSARLKAAAQHEPCLQLGCLPLDVCPPI